MKPAPPEIQPQEEGQFGETRLLREIFAGRTTGVAVEVGANDGVYGSCTRFFERQGWNVLLIEPIPELAEHLRATRQATVVECACSRDDGQADFHLSGELYHHSSLSRPAAGSSPAAFPPRTVAVRVRRLDDVLQEAGVNSIDFITIDVEGHELEVLAAFDTARWQPQVIIVEDNSLGGNRALFSALEKAGYGCFKQTGVNFWFTPRRGTRLISPREIRKMQRTLVLRKWHRAAAAMFPEALKRAVPVWLKARFRY